MAMQASAFRRLLLYRFCGLGRSENRCLHFFLFFRVIGPQSASQCRGASAGDSDPRSGASQSLDGGSDRTMRIGR